MRLPRKLRVSLFTQIALLISFIIFASMALSGTLFSVIVDQIIVKYIGQQAITVAKMTAADPRIISAFNLPNPSAIIQPIAEAIRIETDASYVVVGNKDGIRYSHTDPERIGKEMVGGDNGPVLEGRSIISEAVGSLGPSLRGKTPVYNADGDIIGIVSVGFLADHISDIGDQYRRELYSVTVLLLALGCVGAYFISRRVKKLILGLEPEQISFVYQEREATLESIRDAIVAVNMQEEVVSMNKRARELLGYQQLSVGIKLTNTRLQTVMHEVSTSGQGVRHRRVFLDPHLFAMNVEPIALRGAVIGVVFTFHSETEIEQLTNEFSKIKAFSEHMRAQNHEYLNKLNTIYGLLILEHYDKAIELISDEVKERQDVIAFLMSSVREPLIAACLLGKINRAKELKVDLAIDPDSHLQDLPATLDAKSLVTVLGNIIDNGMEAAREHRSDAVVRVAFTDLGKDLIFDIEDNGPGIPHGKESAIFVDGYSSKPGGNRGLGLAIVKHALQSLQGEVLIDQSDMGGARFTIVIPKSKESR